MSKQTVKPSMPGPYDPPALQPPIQQKPAQVRKASQPSGVNKFYDGPTVTAKAEEVKKQVQTTAKATAIETKRQSKKAAAAVRRHPWSFISILTTIPFLITMSLFSTVVCPPPSSAMSPVSRFVLSPLGLHDSSSQHSQLHQTLCYPANVYHSEVLQPYVYPVINKLQDRAQAHPIYVKGLEPAYRMGSTAGQRAWEGPIKPVVERIQRGARRVYLTFVEPHIPYIRNKFTAITAPYTSRLATYHNAYVSPHLNTAGQYAQTAGKRSVDSYNYVKAHPLTGTAGKYANRAFQIGKARTQQVYAWSKPHAIRAGNEAERIAREILGPRVIASLEWSGVQVEKGWAVVKLQVARLYYAHLDPYVGSHLAKAQVAIAPYSASFRKNVYTPYILPALEAFLPPAILAPEPPKSFWALIADILPGSSVTEHKADMKQFHSKIDRASKPANIRVPGSEKIAKAESATKDTKEAKKFDKEEMVRVREAIKERVNQQGKKGYETVRQELLDLNSAILSDDDKFNALKLNGKAELEREFEYLLKGLDKLYTSSTSLTREQVQVSSLQADGRVAKKVQGVKERVDRMKTAWHEMGSPIVKRAQDDLEAALGSEYADLESKMSRMDDVTSRDWTQYKSVREVADSWASKYTILYNGESKDRALAAPAANVARACSSFNTELTDLFENFRDQVRRLKKTAHDRIEAREALAAESSKSAPVKLNTLNKKVEEPQATILPIVEQGEEAAAAAGGIIGKGKEQIMDALHQAGNAASAVKDKVEEPRATILPIVEAGAGAAAVAAGIIGKGKDQIVDALNQASGAASAAEVTAAGAGIIDQAKEAAAGVYANAVSGMEAATTSAEGVAASVQSVVSGAGNNAQSAYDAASSVVHDATRSAMSAVGATPSPESANEHLESLANVVKAGYASAAGNLGDNIHDATRAGMKAVGATPSPEGIAEHVESLASEVSASISSVAVAASASAASLADVAGSAIHDGTRSAGKAIGIEPTPESYAESAGSLLSVASASIDSAASAASVAVHDATRSAIVAAGGTPTPESPADYAASIAAVASAAAASVYGQASASAVSAYSAASTGAGSAGSAVTDQAAALGLEIQEALGLISTTTSEPLASSVSAYLAQLSSAAATDLPDNLSEALNSGSSLLASLRTEAGSSVHSATRAASRAAGVKPTPESVGEYAEKAVDGIKKVGEDARRAVEGYAGGVADTAERVTEGVKKAVGRDEL